MDRLKYRINRRKNICLLKLTQTVCIPFQKFVERYPVRESILSDPYCLQHPRVSQLLHHLLLVEETRAPRVVRFYTTYELGRSGHHLLQQVH